MRIPLTDIFPPSRDEPVAPGLLVMDTTQSPPVPISIKLGDVNQDGFPDFLAIVVRGGGSQRRHTPNLVLSVPCAKGVAGCSVNGNGRRGWQVVKKDADPLLAVEDARSVAFLDMDEDVSISRRSSVNVMPNQYLRLGHAGLHGTADRRPGAGQYFVCPK